LRYPAPFVIEKIIATLPPDIQPYFYRTSTGAEIDLLLDFGLGDFWAIEIKSNRTPNIKKGFHIACNDINAQRRFVIYAGEDTFILGNAVTAISLSQFIQELRTKISY
jgi:predicted AAA+ superfamily ATPase